MKHLNCFFLAAVIANSRVGASSVSSDELKGVFLATKPSLSDGEPCRAGAAQIGRCP
jgi:hypothetical protein